MSNNDKSGSKYAAFAAHMAEGPPLETGALAVGPMSQPSPYSAAAVEATVDHLHQRIRELEADAIALRRERDDLRDAARAVVWAKVRPCYICNRVSTVTDRYDAFCEGHAHLAGVDKQDAPDAPAWRRLVAMVTT